MECVLSTGPCLEMTDYLSALQGGKEERRKRVEKEKKRENEEKRAKT